MARAVENELFTLSVSIVVIGAESISELILRMSNGSCAQLDSSTVRSMKRIPSENKVDF